LRTLPPLIINCKGYFSVGLLLLCLSVAQSGFTQDLENLGSNTLDKIKNNPFKINGGISATGVYYNSDGRSAREPLTYFLQGNLNFSWLSLNMPVSYSITNQGSELGYEVPYKFNRLSFHPKYKWIQTHIGDVAMTFSPYTLSGHQFTGGGVELTPEGGFTFSAMTGRLLKATEDDGQEQTIPAFRRMGYGGKLGWGKEQYKIGLIGFYAKDDINSITTVPEERNITPKENVVLSIDGEVKFAKNYTLKAEYATTAITQDLRSEVSEETGNGLLNSFIENRGSTEYHSAYNAALEMQIDKTKLGIAYEHIDPGYETLGAYFFNNDFENITLNGSRPLFNDKLSLSFNAGYQRDNLKNQKTQATSRFVGALNASIQATDKITLTGSYSNFSTYTNRSLNQFDDINDSDLTDEDLEALEFKQLSQNANINANIILQQGDKRSQNLNLNYSLASSANEQAGTVRVGQANNFHNANVVYTIGFLKSAFTISPSLNYNYSDIGRDDSDAYGGALDFNKKFLEGKLNSSLGAVYNTNNSVNSTTEVLNFRGNASLVVAEKHIFNLNAIQSFNSTTSTAAENAFQELTVTFGYIYTFDVGAPKLKKINIDRKTKTKEDKEFSFSYKTHIFKGAHDSITNEITDLINQPEFEILKQIDVVVETLEDLGTILKDSENTSNKLYKNAGIVYLRYLYEHKNYVDAYHKIVFNSLKLLYRDATDYDYSLKEIYMAKQGEINSARERGETVSEEDLFILAEKEKQYRAHVWMQEKIKFLSFQDVKEDSGILKEFRDKNFSTVFDYLQEEKSTEEIRFFVETKLIEF